MVRSLHIVCELRHSCCYTYRPDIWPYVNAQSGKATYFKKEEHLLGAMKWTIARGLKSERGANPNRNVSSHTYSVEWLREALSKCVVGAHSTPSKGKAPEHVAVSPPSSHGPRRVRFTSESQSASSSQPAASTSEKLYPSLEEEMRHLSIKQDDGAVEANGEGEYA